MISFSVIVTVYNKAPYIYNTIQSVVKQTYPYFELLVINDGSTDTSVAEISKTKDKRIQLINLSNGGVSKARNTGISKASHTYIAFLDGDDCWESTFLENMVLAIQQHPHQHVFSCGAAIKNKQVIQPLTYLLPNNNPIQVINYFKGSLRNSILHPSSIIIHTRVIEHLGAFDEKYQNYEDIQYWFKIGLHYPIVFINKTLVNITSHATGLSTQKMNSATHYLFNDKTAKPLHPTKAFLRVLDMNLYSLALKAKCHHQTKLSKEVYKQIHQLSLVQKMIYALPAPIICGLHQIKKQLTQKKVNFRIIK